MHEECTTPVVPSEPSTPVAQRIRVREDEPGTEGHVLVFDDSDAEPPKRKRGRPESKKKKRPPVHGKEWDFQGWLTAEGVGFITGFCHATDWAYSWRDLEAIFRIPQSTLRYHVQRPPGTFTLNQGERKAKLAAMADADLVARSTIINDVLAKHPLSSVADVQGFLEAEGYAVSKTTVWNDLVRDGWFCEPRPLHPYTDGDVDAWQLRRRKFARERLKVDPRRLIFTDESIFRCVDGKKVQWCKANDAGEFEVLCRESNRWAASCHVWGAIGWDGFKVLVNLSSRKGSGPRGGLTASDYCEWLDEHFIPRLKRHAERIGAPPILVQDGARIHTSRETIEFLKKRGVEVWENWPPHSPDFNPIENLWGNMKGEAGPQLREDLSSSVANKERCWSIVQGLWKDMDRKFIDNKIMSFPNRLKLCLELNGAYTGY